VLTDPNVQRTSSLTDVTPPTHLTRDAVHQAPFTHASRLPTAQENFKRRRRFQGYVAIHFLKKTFEIVRKAWHKGDAKPRPVPAVVSSNTIAPEASAIFLMQKRTKVRVMVPI
jgi:hypothetical protein